jgi:hypothetical protein
VKGSQSGRFLSSLGTSLKSARDRSPPSLLEDGRVFELVTRSQSGISSAPNSTNNSESTTKSARWSRCTNYEVGALWQNIFTIPPQKGRLRHSLTHFLLIRFCFAPDFAALTRLRNCPCALVLCLHSHVRIWRWTGWCVAYLLFKNFLFNGK